MSAGILQVKFTLNKPVNLGEGGGFGGVWGIRGFVVASDNSCEKYIGTHLL
jgi:hypothetical protein